jgi:fatty acid desaturase
MNPYDPPQTTSEASLAKTRRRHQIPSPAGFAIIVASIAFQFWFVTSSMLALCFTVLLFVIGGMLLRLRDK